MFNMLKIFFTLFFFSISAFSANGHVYLGTSLGADFLKPNNSTPQIDYVSGALITDAYPLNNQHTAAPLLSLMGGYEMEGSHWKPSVALGGGVYRNLSHYGYNGHVIETAAGDASSSLYYYSYDINTTRVMAELQLIWMMGQLSPFINFGLGAAWNQMQGYKETAITSNGYPPLPAFQSKTNVNFAYQAGFGVSHAFSLNDSKSDFQKERISFGYRYANLGTASFGTRGSAYPYQLNTGKLDSNEVYLSYIHLF